MKSASVVQLLKIGHFLFQMQSKFTRILGVKPDFFKDEMISLLQIILIYMGIVRWKDHSTYIVNTDHYGYVTSMFWSYCKSEISEDEMLDLIHVLKMDEVQVIEVNGEKVSSVYSADSIHFLFELKNLLHLKRVKLNTFINNLSDYYRAELKIMHVALEEMGRNS